MFFGEESSKSVCLEQSDMSDKQINKPKSSNCIFWSMKKMIWTLKIIFEYLCLLPELYNESLK